MRKVLIGLITIMMAASLISPAAVATKDACDITGVKDPLICGTEDSDEETALQNRVRDVLNTIYLWIGIISVIVVVIGGILYMTSAGDPNKAKTAKNAITYSVVGLVVTLAAFAITNLVIGAIDGNTSGGIADSSSEDKEKRDEVKSIMMLSSTHLTVGDKAQMRAKVVPDYAKNKEITWSTDNAKILSVDKNGTIVAKKDGVANVKATANNGKYATAKVTVLKPIEVESVSFAKTSVVVKKGSTITVQARVRPYDATNKSLTWKSADKQIAVVDSEGRIRGIKEGTTTVTATSNNNKTGTLKVEVGDPSAAQAVKITDDFINHLNSHYNQTNYMNDSVSCRSGYGGVTCGISAYLAAVYTVTRKDFSYHDTTEEACATGFFNGGGSEFDKVVEKKKSFYENKYGVTGKVIPNTWDAMVAELKKGHPIVILVRGPGGFRYPNTDGMHYVVLLSYRSKNGGEIYAWNPIGVEFNSSLLRGWMNRTTATEWAINHGVTGGGYLPWAVCRL